VSWSDLFLASGAVINIANGDWVATHTTGILTVGTGDLRVTTAGTNAASAVTVGGTQTLTNKTMTSPVLNTPTVGTSLLPTTDDGAALGSTSKKWSDLFLASGGVINWAVGDVTITHSANLLAFAGASSGYTFDVPIGVASGGTGASSLTANNVLLGNGTSALQVVAPGTSGNVLTSNGTTWTSAAPTGASTTYNAVGSYALLYENNGVDTSPSGTRAGNNLTPSSANGTTSGGTRSGTWTAMGYSNGSSGTGSARVTLWVRSA